jgi:hypothetical protein
MKTKLMIMYSSLLKTLRSFLLPFFRTLRLMLLLPFFRMLLLINWLQSMRIFLFVKTYSLKMLVH